MRSVEMARKSEENATVLRTDADLKDTLRVPAREAAGAIDAKTTAHPRLLSLARASMERAEL